MHLMSNDILPRRDRHFCLQAVSKVKFPCTTFLAFLIFLTHFFHLFFPSSFFLVDTRKQTQDRVFVMLVPVENLNQVTCSRVQVVQPRGIKKKLANHHANSVQQASNRLVLVAPAAPHALLVSMNKEIA